MTSQFRYSSPPNWPAPPEGWAPHEGWTPPPDWPAPPPGWQFWVPITVTSEPERPSTIETNVAEAPQATRRSQRHESTKPESVKIPLFGARKTAQALVEENAHLRRELERLGALESVTIQEELGRARSAAEAERARLNAALADIRDETADEQAKIATAIQTLEAERTALALTVTDMTETSMLQEIGIYDFSHPLDDAAAYKSRLDDLRRQIKEMSKANGGAIQSATGWTVNGSAAEGKRMVSQTSKLMLRAYNAEADNLVRTLKPYRLSASIDRLSKTTQIISKLGQSMSIRVDPRYHSLRLDELALTADYLEKVAQEKEVERAAREALREQRKVEAEMARERQRLEKERDHYTNALSALREKGDHEGAARLEAELADVERAINDVDYRTANQRAGYVYVISNVGAFGDRMIKVGMTRRLVPMDRVRELGDASVPFRFDVHALFFSNDAVGIEAEMHRRLDEVRVNRINLRREFFYATPLEALAHLRDLAGEVLEFREVAEAVEFRQSSTPQGPPRA